MINIAIVGFGLSGRYLQAPFFWLNPNFHLKTIVTNNQNPKEIYPSVLKASSLAEVLADSEIELVSIASPNATHVDYARQCLLAGKHVLVEKPFAPTLAEAQMLIDLAKNQGKNLFIFQNRRFDSDFMTVQKVIESGFLGEIHTYEVHWNRYKPLPNPKKWKEIVAPASGIIYDLGSHLIDQTIALFGRPLSILGETYTQREHSLIDDAFNIRLNYGKLKATITSSLMTRGDLPRYVVHGSKGSFVKHGIDVQEDNAKAGITPDMPTFGIEPPQYQGVLDAEINALHFKGTIETEKGD